MPRDFGYSYGGPRTKHTASGMLGGGTKGQAHSSPMRQKTTGDSRYRSMERQMFHDSGSHGMGKGPWPKMASGKGNGGNPHRY